MAEVKETISIGSKADTRGFKKAESAATKLNKTLRNLAGTFGVVYSTTQLIQFSKVAVRAFAEDEKAALSLARTVQNLGLGFEAQGAAVNDYLSVLEKQTGVLDDELRPAMDRLLRSTLDVTKSQDLLALSLDIAAGTGKSVTQVSQSLQKAYLGQKQAIGRLGVGLSKAELQTASFEDIQQKLAYLFAGQAQDAANSYAGQIDRLTIASNNAKETIGKGLVDALITLTGSGDIEGLVTKMDRFANAIADASRQMAKLIVGFKFFANPKNIFKSGTELEELFARIDMGQAVRQFNPLNNAVTGYQLDKKQQKEAQRLAAIQAKLLKDAIKAEKAKAAELKKQAALKRAGNIFDLEQIQIIAALKGKLSDEDRKRVELQLALITGNEEQAKKLTLELAKAQGLGVQLAAYLASLPDAKNPFKAWDDYLNAIEERLKKGFTTTVTTTQVSTAVSSTSGAVIGFVPPQGVYPTPSANPQGPVIPATNVDRGFIGTPFGQAGGNGSGFIGTPFGQAGTIELKITGEGDITNAIAKGLQNQSLSTGDSSYINRRTGGFAG
jgi:hypothetical protein